MSKLHLLIKRMSAETELIEKEEDENIVCPHCGQDDCDGFC